ncbi:MAG: DinB family protein [Chloroflexi bacterium]|nr:DinB family protein [Chloroflexota bacterium]MCL5273832.1 DinB family protein [Chloroflexota bacterium]
MTITLMETVCSVLKTTPQRWQTLVETLPMELLSRKPAPKEWSALECLQHIVDAERYVLPVRVRAFLAGQDFPAFNPDRQGTKPGAQSPAELCADFISLRAASLALLGQLKPDDLQRTARHAELGVVTLEQMLHEWAGHDLMHTVQAERAMMQPFIRGCGPWKIYFTDHDAGGA